jgi:hypothetical protein
MKLKNNFTPKNIKNVVLFFLLLTPFFALAQAKPKPATGNTKQLDLSSKGIYATVTVPKEFKIIEDEYDILFGNGKDIKIKIEETTETFASVKKFTKENSVRGFVKFVSEEATGFICEFKPMSSSEFDFRYFANVDGKNYMLQDLGSDRHESVETIKKMYGYAKSLKLKGDDFVSNEPVKAASNIFFYTNGYKTKLTNDTQFDFTTLSDLEVVVPITAEMKKYDKFQIGLIEKDKKNEINGRGVYIALDPESKEFSIDYSNKKEIRLSLYNKAAITNKELNPELYRGTFFKMFKESDNSFTIIVEGLIKNGSAWSESQMKYYDTYKAKTLHSTLSVSNSYRPKVNECPFLVNDNYYTLNVGSDVTVLNNRTAGTIWWYADSLKLSNGMVLEIKTVALRNSGENMASELKRLKLEVQGKQYMDHRDRPQVVKIEKEESNYFVYTNRETNLIGGAGKKILSSGLYYFGLSTDGKTLFYIVDRSKTITKAEDYATKIEFYKKLIMKPGL